MSQQFIGEIRCFGFVFAPRGWAKCNGQLVSIAQSQALFSILGTTYGGDGQTTFGLPNLQGQIPMHWGNGPGGFNTSIGEVQGVSNATLTVSQIPQHSHAVTAAKATAAAQRTAVPSSQAFLSGSQAPNVAWENPGTAVTSPFSPKAITMNGNSQPHDNMQPYLALNFCIALEGIFPSRN
ncbi:MAG: phage tail protein [Propylenella sp.]